MDALKRSPEQLAMRLLLFDIFGSTPKAVSDIPSSMLSSKASIVMTNVAGSPRTLHVAGVPIERLMFWVPHPGEHLGMGISILSYRGEVTLAVVVDARLVPDPETITALFNREFATMLAAARRAAPRRAGPQEPDRALRRRLARQGPRRRGKERESRSQRRSLPQRRSLRRGRRGRAPQVARRARDQAAGCDRSRGIE